VIPDALFTAAGVVGATLYLGAYAGLQAGFIRGDGYAFPALNLVAAACVLVSLSAYFNPFSTFIEISWMLLSLFGIARLWLLTRGLTFTEEERTFLDAALPGISRLAARRFLAGGRWEDLAPGTVLTREEMPVDRLTYLASGSARVTLEGVEVATIPQGLFVGELGVLTRAPATATVTVTQPTRAFAIQADILADLVARHPGLKLSLDAGVGADARRKILGANRRLRSLGGQPGI
jgi:CRP-like cAMP-binding protein